MGGGILKKLIILVGMFTLCLGLGYLGFSERKPEPTTSILSWDKPPVCDPNQIREFKLTRFFAQEEREEIIFKRTDPERVGSSETAQRIRTQWSIAQPNYGEAETSMAQRIVSSVCDMPRAVRIKSPNFTKLGLVDPLIEVSFTIPSEEEEYFVNWRYSFGKELPGKKMSMMFSADNVRTMAFTVPRNLKRFLSPPSKSFRNRRVMQMPLDTVDFMRVSMEGKERFTLERAGSEWKIIVNQEEMGTANKTASQFVNRLGTLRAMDILDSNLDSDKCGRLNHIFAIDVEGVGNRKERILFAKPKELVGRKRIRILACSSRRTTLFGVHSDMWNYLAVDVNSLKRKESL